MSGEAKTFLDTVIEYGATGVLALVCAAQTKVIHHLWKKINEIQDARLKDIQAYTVRAEALHDKVYKTADDMNKMTEALKERRTR